MKIRVSEKNKNLILGLLTLLMVIVVFIAMFFPEIIEYEYSLSHLSNKKDSIDSTVVQLKTNENTIEELKGSLTNKMEEQVQIEERVGNLRSVVNNRDFELHVPSLFVSLEESAKANDLEITIFYDQFNSNATSLDGRAPVANLPEGNGEIDPSQGPEPNIPVNVNEESPNIEAVEGDVQDNPNIEKDKAPPNDKDEERPSRPSAPTDRPDKNDGFNDSSIKFATLPISITGDYVNIRDFIRNLDELDLIEASIIEVSSDGLDVVAGIALRIYYGGVTN